MVVTVPPQTVAEAFATINPTGKVSVKSTPVKVTVFAAGLVMVNVKEVVPFKTIELGLKTLLMLGGATTSMLAEAVPPVPPSVEVTLFVVLFCKPAAVPVTFTEKVHELLAAKLAPERLIKFVPCVAVMVPPPHVPTKPFGVAIIRPPGKVSLNATPFNTLVVLLFWIVKLNDVEPFNGIEAAPNALMITGGATTVNDAFEVLPVPPLVEVT